jgi:hypothetical protein
MMTRTKAGRPSYHDTQLGDQADRNLGKPAEPEKPDPDDGEKGPASQNDSDMGKR